MKKALCFLLAALMVFLLVACNETPSEKDDQTGKTDQTQTNDNQQNNPNDTDGDQQTTSSTHAPKWKIATTTGDLKGHSGYETEEKAIRGLYEAGFRYIDFSMYSFTQSCVWMQSNWRTEALKLKALADELGMEFVQAHSQGGNPLSTNAQTANFIVEATIRSIEICEVLGIKNTVVHAGYGSFTKEEWFAKNKEFYEKLLPTAERCGVNILTENSTSANMGSKYYINTAADMLEFIEYVDHPNFHACWDTGHANCEFTGYHQYNEILTLGKEMYAIHYADNMGDGDTHLLPYCGTLDHDWVLKALEDVEFNGYFTLECDGSKRGNTDYTGPEFPGLTDVFSNGTLAGVTARMTRSQQEELLYQITDYILRHFPSEEVAKLKKEDIPFYVFSSPRSYGEFYHGKAASVTSDENTVTVSATKNSSQHCGFIINKSAIASWIQMGYKTLSFKFDLTQSTGAVPAYALIYIQNTFCDYHLTTPDIDRGDGREYIYANGKELTVDLVLLNSHLTAGQGLQFLIYDNNLTAVGNCNVTFSNVKFGK